MEIIVHHPQTPEKEMQLKKQVAAAYAQAVRRYIEGLNCSKSQKMALFNSVLEAVKPK